MIAVGGGKTKLVPPFQQISAFHMIDRSELDLGVQTAEGWFVFSYPGKGQRSQAHCGGTRFTVKQLGVTEGRASELRVAYRSFDDGCSHRDHSWAGTRPA